MALKNINEIQSSNYSKHTEQFYQESLSALANSGQRYGTPGKGFTNITLSLRDIFPNIIDSDTSYIQATVKANYNDLKRYQEIVGENVNSTTFSKIEYNQIVYNKDTSEWSSTNLDEIRLSDKEDIITTTEEQITIPITSDETYKLTELYTVISDSIDELCADGEHNLLAAVTIKPKKNEHCCLFFLKKLSLQDRERLTRTDTPLSNYRIEYFFDLTEDETAGVSTIFYAYPDEEKSSTISTIKYKITEYNIRKASDNQSVITSFKNLYNKFKKDNENKDYSASLKDFIDILNTSQKAPLAPETFTATWNENSHEYEYKSISSKSIKDSILYQSNKLIKIFIEKHLTSISKNINKKFINNLFWNNFSTFYKHFSDSQILDLKKDENDKKDYLELTSQLTIDSSFNILVQTGEDGNVTDDLHYYSITDPIVFNHCITNDFNQCTKKFLLSDNTDSIISNADALYNINTKDKFINILYRCWFEFATGDNETELLSQSICRWTQYLMPYLNDNGYWVVNEQETGILGTCKNAEQANIVIIHNSKNGTDDNKNLIIKSEYLSSYRKDDFEKVNLIKYTTTTDNLLKDSGSQANYSVPVYLPDYEQTLNSPSLSYLTDYLRSTLFVCITDTDCLDEKIAVSENCFITTFWVFDEDKEKSKYFKPISSEGIALDLNKLTNFNSLIKYAIANQSINPDQYYHSQVVFDNINERYKNSDTENPNRYPFIQNVLSYVYNNDDGGLNIIPIEDLTNNANLVLGFASEVLNSSDADSASNGSIDHISRKKPGATFEKIEATGGYKIPTTKISNANDYVITADKSGFVDTLDLSSVIINHNNIYNRTNFIIPSESNESTYSSYIGTSPDATDKSWLYLGTSSNRLNINNGVIDSSIKDPFKKQQGIKIQFDNIQNNAENITLKASTSITIDSPQTTIAGFDQGSSGSPSWITAYDNNSLTLLTPVLHGAEFNSYITSTTTMPKNTFIDDEHITTYKFNVAKYLNKFYKEDFETTAQPQPQVIIKNIKDTNNNNNNNNLYVVQPIVVYGIYDKTSKKIKSILSATPLDF